MSLFRSYAVLLVLLPAVAWGCRAVSRPGMVSSAIQMDKKSAGETAALALEKKDQEKAQGLNIAIVPFVDKRGSLKSYGSVYSYLIPLVPYGTMRYERPDQARMFNTQDEIEFNMNDNLIKIIVDNVKKTGLFSNVILTPTPLESGSDLILSGEINSTLYEGKTYSYGISFLGPALWCLGLPAGSSHKKLSISLYLKKADTGETIWSYAIDKEKTVIQGLYHNWGKNMNSFIGLMESGIKDALSDMRQKLSGFYSDKLKVKQPDSPLPQQQTSLPAQENPAVSVSETKNSNP